jgi:hypothetical protein
LQPTALCATAEAWRCTDLIGAMMSAWRRKALVLFPELKDELNTGDYSIYQLYFDILPMEQEAHDHDD